jgi:uncharacterized DUF497 family protein
LTFNDTPVAFATVEFEWDPRKARQNEAKHGVPFELAVQAFDDPHLVLAEDAGHSGKEARYFAFGQAGGGVLTVRFTVRGVRVRIIGAGYWHKGRAFYAQANRLHR